jgi:cell division protease FtsH
MANHLRKLYRRRRPDLRTFLLHATIRRSLRSVLYPRRSAPPIVGLLLDEEYLVAEVKEAVSLRMLKPDDGRERRFPDSVAEFVEFDGKSSKGWGRKDDLDAVFFYKAAATGKPVFGFAATVDDFPESFHLLADAVVVLEQPTARQIQDGLSYCHGIHVSLDEAKSLSGYPLGYLAMAATRGAAWRRVFRSMLDADIDKATTAAAEERSRKELRLEDLAGLGEAGDWGHELARDLADWKTGKISWSDVDRGVLLAGAPGTGKTTYAKALANTCGIKLIASSVAQWQSKGHLGDLLKAMRGSFSEAKRDAPCILFLDEFDSIGDRATVRGDGARYQIEVINGLLECIDGVEDREGVVIVGACNHPWMIDPALLRPGRLERSIQIPLPNVEAREQILRWHLNGALEGEGLRHIADRMEGRSGADIEKLVRDARRKARRARRGITREDLADHLPKRIAVPLEVLQRTAVHEAGHAIVHAALGEGEMVSLSIMPEFEADSTSTLAGALEVKLPLSKCRSRKDHENRLAVWLAGLAAEEIVFGSYSDGGGGVEGSDLDMATQLAVEIEASFGLGEGLVQLVYQNSKNHARVLVADRDLRRKVDGILKQAFEAARKIVTEQKTAHEALVKALLERHKLAGSEVLEIIS